MRASNEHAVMADAGPQLDKRQVVRAARALLAHLAKEEGGGLLAEDRMVYLQVAMKQTPTSKQKPVRM